MSEESTQTTVCPAAPQAGLCHASLLLRLWLAVRAIQTGVEKYTGIRTKADAPVLVDGVPNAEGLSATSSAKYYAMDQYHGIPAGLLKKFEGEPMMLKAMLPLYDKFLGPALIVLGVAILLGIFYRSSLFLLGLLYISLTWGLILIKQDDGVSWLGVHVIIVAMALALASHNRFSLMKKW